MSIALRVLPSKLELKRRDGSGRLAPRANVSFTTFLYVSPVQTIPWCDQTGTPAIAFDGFFHFRSSIISGSASRISARMRARVSSRQSLRLADPLVDEPRSGFPGRACLRRGLGLWLRLGSFLDSLHVALPAERLLSAPKVYSIGRSI